MSDTAEQLALMGHQIEISHRVLDALKVPKEIPNVPVVERASLHQRLLWFTRLDDFAIFYEGKLFVIARVNRVRLPNEILDYYARDYGFERKKLSGGWVQSVVIEYE